MCLQNYWKVFAPLTPRIHWTTSISSDVLTWVLPGLGSWGEDFARQRFPKQKRRKWSFNYWKDWPWSQTPPTQTCSIGGVLCPAGPKSTSPSYSREGISRQGNPVVRLNDAEVQCHPQQVWKCDIVAFTSLLRSSQIVIVLWATN